MMSKEESVMNKLNFQKWAIVCLCLVGLNAAIFAATYTVTTTDDSGPGSLRQAILDANAHSGADVIVFNIPAADPHFNSDLGVWTIRPLTPLPLIWDEGLIIDGSSQAVSVGKDANPFGPEIELDGSKVDYGDGLHIRANGVEIIELVINRFLHNDGIYFERANGGLVAGCYIGTDPTGMREAGNSAGIWVWRCRRIALQPLGDKPNIVSGNPIVGICITDSSKHCVISGNIIGLNRTGDDVIGNGMTNYYGGIRISDYSDSNAVIDNRIGGNKYTGIFIFNACDNLLADNCIGSDRQWSLQFPNTSTGIRLYSYSGTTPPEKTTGNRILNNIIANHSYCGIAIEGIGSFNNLISANAISHNSPLGILLSDGANRSIAAPTITQVSATQISGTSQPGYRIEVFCDEGKEGRIFLGSVTTDASGQFHLPISSVPPMPHVTATATDADGNTSAFSAAVWVSVKNDHQEIVCQSLRLLQNYPNPFNATTTIPFTITQKGRVRLSLYNFRGQLMAVLLDEELLAGEHLLRLDAGHLPSGVYHCRLEQNAHVSMQKLVVLR